MPPKIKKEELDDELSLLSTPLPSECRNCIINTKNPKCEGGKLRTGKSCSCCIKSAIPCSYFDEMIQIKLEGQAFIPLLEASLAETKGFKNDYVLWHIAENMGVEFDIFFERIKVSKEAVERLEREREVKME